MVGSRVPLADLEVERVVRRGDLHRPRAEVGIHGVVRHHGNLPAHHRQQHLAADQVPVPLVLRMHRDGRVAQHRLGAGGGDGEMAAAVGERIAQMPDLPVYLILIYFLIGERGEAAGTPVDDVMPAVDQALFVQLDERLPYGARESFIQGEVGARPVGRAADGFELLEDHRAGFPNVGPDPLDERVAPQIEASEALLGEQSLDHVLGGDAGVVGAGNPEGPAPAHALEADQHVLHGVVETVTHVQHRRDVRRWHLDHVGLAGAGGMGLGREESALGPPAVQLGLDRRWIVLRGERFAHALWSVTRLPPGMTRSSSPRTRMLLMTVSTPDTARRHSGGEGAGGTVSYPASELDAAAADRHHLEGAASQTRLGSERGFDGPGRCGRGVMQPRGSAQALGHPADAGLVHPADPLAQGKPGQQAGAHAERAPEQNLGPAQPVVSSHARPLTEGFTASIKLTFFRSESGRSSTHQAPHGSAIA